MRYGILKTDRKSLLLIVGDNKMGHEKELDELDVPVYEQDNHLNQFYWDELETEEINLTEVLK